MTNWRIVLTCELYWSTAFILLPVECGDQGCKYDNLCIAEASGFLQTDCAQATALTGHETVPPTEGGSELEEGTASPSGESTMIGSVDPSTMVEPTCPVAEGGVCGASFI